LKNLRFLFRVPVYTVFKIDEAAKRRKKHKKNWHILKSRGYWKEEFDLTLFKNVSKFRIPDFRSRQEKELLSGDGWTHFEVFIHGRTSRR